MEEVVGAVGSVRDKHGTGLTNDVLDNGRPLFDDGNRGDLIFQCNSSHKIFFHKIPLQIPVSLTIPDNHSNHLLEVPVDRPANLKQLHNLIKNVSFILIVLEMFLEGFGEDGDQLAFVLGLFEVVENGYEFGDGVAVEDDVFGVEVVDYAGALE